MTRTSWLISKYLVRSIVPYFAFAWLLLSVILFLQQASRFSDIFFNVNIPAKLVWQLTIALIPNVIAFTCPMAMLVGTIIGLSKMQVDSELVVIRASGVGNLQITAPIAVLGISLSVFAFVVNLKGVPLAASLVRSVALETALQKLDSPVEPGIFNTEIPGYTMYVRNGDVGSGRWEDIFIFTENPAAGIVRLITSKGGRIDASGDQSELVLENATATTLPIQPGANKYVTENIGEIRVAIASRRAELIRRMGKSGARLEELGLSELSDYAASTDGRDRVEAQLLWQRRIILSISPLLFCLLGAAMILRFNRGGRGFGTLLALIGLVGYFLLGFVGEQLARTGQISVVLAGVIPLAGSLFTILWFNYSGRITIARNLSDWAKSAVAGLRNSPERMQTRNLLVDLTTGLRDLDLVFDLVRYFLLTLAFLTAIFVIFTASELWKYAGSINGGAGMLFKYLFYLLPFVYMQIAPSAAMISTLATYIIKSRRNEIVTWTAAGQSIYRLLIPCFVLTILLGLVDWQIQERILPGANQTQDAVRELIMNRGVPVAQPGRFWAASGNRIYSFATASDNEKATLVSHREESGVDIAASDNEQPIPPCSAGCVKDIAVYELDQGKGTLQTVYRAKYGQWQHGRVALLGSTEKADLRDGAIETSTVNGIEFVENSNPFMSIRKKPSHLNTTEIKQQITNSDSETERRSFGVALEKRYAAIMLPLIIALFTAPFALSLSRKGKAETVGYAVGLWLIFAGVSSVFEQFGLNGSLSPMLAVWSPLMIFTMLGVYLLSKVRT